MMFGLSTNVIAWILSLTLGSVTVLLSIVLLRKPKQYDPQQGQAQGCLMLVLLVVILFDVLIAGAIIFDWPQFLTATFGIVCLPLIWILLGLVYNFIRWVSQQIHPPAMSD